MGRGWCRSLPSVSRHPQQEGLPDILLLSLCPPNMRSLSLLLAGASVAQALNILITVRVLRPLLLLLLLLLRLWSLADRPGCRTTMASGRPTSARCTRPSRPRATTAMWWRPSTTRAATGGRVSFTTEANLTADTEWGEVYRTELLLSLSTLPCSGSSSG